MQKVCHTPKDNDSAHSTPSAWETLHLQAFSCHANRKKNVTLTSESRFLSGKQGCFHHQEGVKHRKWMSVWNWSPLAKYLIHSRLRNPNGHAKFPLWLSRSKDLSKLQNMGFPSCYRNGCIFHSGSPGNFRFYGFLFLIFQLLSHFTVSFSLFFLSLFLSNFLTISPLCLLSLLVRYIFFTLPSTFTKEMNVAEEKLNEFFELVITVEELKKCLYFMVKNLGFFGG